MPNIPVLEPHITLDADEQEALQQRLIKKHDTAVILLHWFNACIWALELATGGALLAGDGYRIAPAWWRDFMISVFGSQGMILKVHVTAGIIWTTVLLVYGIFGFRKYLLRTVTNYLVPDRDDLRWLRSRLFLILGRPETLPPQGIYNGGQKLYGIVVYLGTAVIILTGFIMAHHIGPNWLVQWSILFHFLAAGGIFAGLFVHVYMGAVLPEERPAFYSMFTGKVPELYAYKHHYKWWRQYKETEAEWREELAREVESKPSSAPDGPAAKEDP
ncbi:MAG: cytochrome b/b6 domain-containing protein [Polyangia bacterium]|jgi:formate dehydrogenase subunit gamma|nr:cytochrome b/b6 domain-containing protein [Polyangia bacterium]